MLAKGTLLQAPGELNSSVDEWATFGGFFLMLHIPLLLIQRCVVFRFQSEVDSFNDILYKGHEFNRSLYKVFHKYCSVILGVDVPSG